MSVKSKMYQSVAIMALACGLVFGVAGRAMAGDALLYAPAPAWVKPISLGAADPAQKDAPAQVLLESFQSDFTPDGDSFYSELALRIQTPAGLSMAQPSVAWNPQTDTVTVHKVQILRGDKVIDLLAGGKTFTVVRRETNLEQSMLDGVLTGILQPEDLQVGDILVYAMTRKRQDPIVKGHSEALFANSAQVPIGRFHVRTQWEGGKSVQWRASSDLPAAAVTRTADGGSYSLDIPHALRPDVPEGAPDRFGQVAYVEFSQFGSWGEIATLMAPLYDKASHLGPDSVVKAEAAKIRAAGSDPKIQAAAALRLVEDQVRYVFIGLDQGGYVPADADVTWTRRFGDCKGKTTLLLALLHELNIEAEPALVSTQMGDGLDTHLPLLEMFDHVIVRATIAGKVYWLDGTRSNDRDLDSIAVPNFHYALPVKMAGAQLEALKPAPLDKPSQELRVKLDASAGLDVPARAHLEQTLRGDDAIAMRLALEALPADQRDKNLRAYWKSDYDWIEPQKVSATFDAVTGDEVLTMDGVATMAWTADGGTRTWRYETDGTRVGWGYETTRTGGGHIDAPIKIMFPAYYHNREEIILPKGGKGFTVDGDTVDKTMGGADFKRSWTLANGVLTIDSSKRALVPEISYADQLAAAPVLTAMYKKPVLLVAPAAYKADMVTDAKTPGDTTKSADDLADEAGQYFTHQKYDLALGRFNQALRLDPANAKALLGRALVFMYGTHNNPAALVDLQQAVKSDPTQWRAYDAMGAVYQFMDKPAEAVDAYSKAIAIYPNDTNALSFRAQAYFMNGDTDKARADAETVLQYDPANAAAVGLLSQMALNDKKRDDARAIVQRAIDVNPDDPQLYLRMADIDGVCFDPTPAKCEALRPAVVADYDKAIALAPSAYALSRRATARAKDDRKAALDDLAQAMAMEPKNIFPYLTRAGFYADDKDNDKALADINQAIAIDPKNAAGYRSRAYFYLQTNKPDLAFADIDKLVADHPDDSESLNMSCWERATRNRDLDLALAHCNAGVKAAPKNAAIIDSRAFVELRLGRLDESIADYDAALKINPKLLASLYGRGIAKLRKGLTAEGKADLAAARKGYAKIDDMWAGYGIKP